MCTATSRGWCFFVVCHSCLSAVAARTSYPGRLCVLVLQQADELGEALLHCLHVVDGAALQDPALPSSQRLQLEILLDLPAETEGEGSIRLGESRLLYIRPVQSQKRNPPERPAFILRALPQISTGYVSCIWLRFQCHHLFAGRCWGILFPGPVPPK